MRVKVDGEIELARIPPRLGVVVAPASRDQRTCAAQQLHQRRMLGVHPPVTTLKVADSSGNVRMFVVVGGLLPGEHPQDRRHHDQQEGRD